MSVRAEGVSKLYIKTLREVAVANIAMAAHRIILLRCTSFVMFFTFSAKQARMCEFRIPNGIEAIKIP